MNIVLVSDFETQGGAAQSASRLAEALCEHAQVTRIVLFPDGRPHSWRTVSLVREETPWRRQLLRGPRRFWPERFPRPATVAFASGQLDAALRRLRPDVVNFHNLHGAAPWGWGPELVAVAARFAPVAWTLHDMWSFTGRCAYAYDCERFIGGCSADCPTAGEHPRLRPLDIPSAWRARADLFAHCPELIAVTPSCWLAEEARRGLWRDHRVEVIPYGVPTTSLRPKSRAAARAALGIPADRPVILMAAVDLTERRKGGHLLPGVWQQLRPEPLTLLTMGQGALPEAPSFVDVHPLGWIDGPEQLALAYSAADVLLHPAPVDNFPNVILEAFACGTPAVGQPIGGVREQIRPGLTGWLAAAPTAQALGKSLQEALDAIRGGVDLRESSRQVAVSEFPLERQARRYLDLFSESGVQCPDGRPRVSCQAFRQAAAPLCARRG